MWKLEYMHTVKTLYLREVNEEAGIGSLISIFRPHMQFTRDTCKSGQFHRKAPVQDTVRFACGGILSKLTCASEICLTALERNMRYIYLRSHRPTVVASNFTSPSLHFSPVAFSSRRDIWF